MSVKAIDTVYKGYKFRSRLEARWAVFFDELKIKWEYEKEGFEFELAAFGKIRYLPDFYMPEWDKYVEIKPNKELEESEIVKSFGFVQKAEKTLLMIKGDPWPSGYSILLATPALSIPEKKIICSLCLQRSLFAVGRKTYNIYLLDSETDFETDFEDPYFLPLTQPFVAWKSENGEMGHAWVFSEEQLNSGNLPIIDDLTDGGIEFVFNEEPIKGLILDDAYITARQYRFEHRRSDDAQFSGNQAGLRS